MTNHLAMTRATLIDPEPGERHLVHIVPQGEKRTLCGVTILILLVDDTFDPLEYDPLAHRDEPLCHDCKAAL